jgi:hypothetical protein
MADTNSIFYKIGQATKASVNSAIDALKAANNTWAGTNDFNAAVTVGTTDVPSSLTVTGTASTSGKLTANSLEVTNAATVGGNLTVGTEAAKKDATVSQNLTVNGNLEVKGATTTLSTTNLDVKDNIIRLSKGASSDTYSKDSGLLFERGTDKNAAAFVYDESEESFVAGTTEGTSADATLTTTPAPLTVGSLKLATVALGDYADFLSGANMDADFNTLPA